MEAYFDKIARILKYNIKYSEDAMLNVKGKNVLVYGMGISGQAACKLLHDEGACVSTFDDEGRFISYFTYEKNPMLKRYDFVVVSPGIKVLGNQLISHFVMSGTKVISELDLGFSFCRGKVIGITGTNGKTTVTSLVGDIFKKAGRKTFVCGNIGLPICSIAPKTDDESVIVCEVSNFQLELSSMFKAGIACVLNLAPDHIDRHGSFEEYLRVKGKILSHSRSQRVVLNYDDEMVNKLQINRKTLFFSKNPLNKGVFVKNNAIFYNKVKVMPLSEIPLFGEKNLENVLAAISVSVLQKIKPSVIRSAVNAFKAPPHRIEYLGQVNGADVFDDSKATNISSTISAVGSLGERGLVLMLGGCNKGFVFDEIFNKGWDFEKLICFGDAGHEIFETASKYGYSPLLFPTMKAATYYVKENAQSGQKILLSPACSSFDEFASYAVRGEVFKEIMFGDVKQIEMS